LIVQTPEHLGNTMQDTAFTRQCIFNALDGVQDGLSRFSGPSRVALLYAMGPTDPIHVVDPQNLLLGHEPKLQELFLDSDDWRLGPANPLRIDGFKQFHPVKNLELAGLISYGARSNIIFYQMWFTEHHPDMCSIGPTECWLEHAAWLLAHDLGTDSNLYTRTTGYVLRGYATHAVRDFMVDEMNVFLGWDTYIRVYPILDAVLGISETREEGAWPKGELVFVEPHATRDMDFMIQFPHEGRPMLSNFKHVRKILQAVENSDRRLIADGQHIVGITTAALPAFNIIADFRRGYGFLSLNGNPVCSFFNGSFHSTTHKAKLVQLEELLLETPLELACTHQLFQIIAALVHSAETEKHGCTLVLDLNLQPIVISGQRLEHPLDLRQPSFLELAKALAKVDGALHIGTDMHLHSFACLLDGRTVPGEDRARGARYNSALRFSSEHRDIIVVVVSSDRPVSIIEEGVEVSAQCQLKPVARCFASPPVLADWLAEK
jgi:hypothetical protein